MRQNVAVFFGGKSCEHDVSVITGLQVCGNIDEIKFNCIPVYITREGRWLTGDKLTDKKSYTDFTTGGTRGCYFEPGSSRLLTKGMVMGSSIVIDAAVVCTHGGGGENGSLQGLLNLSGVPYTSCNVLGSGITMDKISMKSLFKSARIGSLPYHWFYSGEYEADTESVLSQIETKLGYPVMVKPSNLGSSIGVSRCDNREELVQGIEVAARYDNRVLAEQALTDFSEINISCVGVEGQYELSSCEEIRGFKHILSFGDKYVNKDKNIERIVPAQIDSTAEAKIRKTAEKACRLCDCAGAVRVDFLINNTDGKIYINEINSIPGSLSYQLWKASGVSFGRLLDKLIEIAVLKHRAEQELNYSYESAALFNFSDGFKTS
ncbi:MAG: D-alanine--D-alanine ligase [Firmicutes bacterium]|nr:D-alanine--D-alanine ligase [Bacillota bacterium]